MTQHDNHKKVNIKLLALYILMIFGVAIFVIVPYFYPGENLGFNTEQPLDFSADWQLVLPDGTVETVDLPLYRSDVPANTDVVLKKMLPDTYIAGQSLCIRTSMQSLQALVAGQEIYARGLDHSKFLGSTIGSSWTVFRIPEHSMGQELTLVLNSPHDNFAGNVNEVFMGSKSGLLFHVLHNYLWGFIVAVIILLAGLLLLLLYWIIYKSILQNQPILYLSLFAVLVSLWLLSESRMLQFFVSDQFLIANLAYITIMLFPMPMVLYVGSVYQPHHHDFTKPLFWCFVVNFCVCVCLQLANLADFFSLLLSTHLLMVVTIVLTTVSVIVEIVKYHNQEAKDFAKSALVLLVFAALELVNFYRNNFMNVSAYFRIGLLVYILCLGYSSVRKLIRIAEKNMEVQYFQRLAYQDLLTGGKNRTAYFKESQNVFLSTEDKGQNQWLLLFDLNNLKLINDNFGHLAGDRALKATYSCIYQAFCRTDRIYRIGGDEFACILLGYDAQQMTVFLHDFQLEIAKVNQETEYEFAVAVGYCQYRSSTWRDFETFAAYVDQLMYENKRSCRKLDFFKGQKNKMHSLSDLDKK